MYNVSYCCNNCGRIFNESFPGGTKAPATIHCNYCGCFTAEKQMKPRRIAWPEFTYPRTQREPEPPMWQWPGYNQTDWLDYCYSAGINAEPIDTSNWLAYQL